MNAHDAAFDVAVAGLGAMGSAAAWCLAREGLRVIGFDPHAPPHSFGSSHGHTRIIREAYFEHPLYVPLVRRAYEAWARLEALQGRRLLRPTGGLVVGPPDGTLLSGARASARRHDLPHEELTAAGIRERFPGFDPPDSMAGILEPRAGILYPERCIEAMLEQAARCGAELRTGAGVESWQVEDEAVVVRVGGGEIRAGRLVIAAGAWTPGLVGRACPPLTVERQLFHRFRPQPDGPGCPAASTPVAIWEYAPGRYFYTFPDEGEGVKIGVHHEGEPADPSTIDRRPRPDEERKARSLLDRYLPGAGGALLEAGVCMYTNTPDGHFVVDRHPESERVVVVSACSGHGFKFAAAIGELTADLVAARPSPIELGPFRLDRPALRRAQA